MITALALIFLKMFAERIFSVRVKLKWKVSNKQFSKPKEIQLEKKKNCPGVQGEKLKTD